MCAKMQGSHLSFRAMLRPRHHPMLRVSAWTVSLCFTVYWTRQMNCPMAHVCCGSSNTLVLVCNHSTWDPLEVWHRSQSSSHQAPDANSHRLKLRPLCSNYSEQHCSRGAAAGARRRTACRNDKRLINGGIFRRVKIVLSKPLSERLY